MEKNRFALQRQIAQALPALQQWWMRYGLPMDLLDQLERSNGQFVMRIPLIGSFSAGKSTLLNQLLEDKLLAVDIDPASSLPVEFFQGEQERIQGHTAQGQTCRLTREQLKEQQFEGLLPDGWVTVELPAPVLQPLQHLSLVDLPGLDSKNTQHEQAINSYLHRSLAYCLVVSAEAGTLAESTRRFLSELKLYKAPVLVVISKADKKPAGEIQAVMAQVRQQVEALLGGQSPIVDVVAVSRRDVAPLRAALYQLEELSEQRFRDTVGQNALALLQQLAHALQQLLNADDLNSEQLQVQLEQHQQEVRAYRDTLARETEQLQSRVSGVSAQVVRRVEDALRGHLDSLAHTLSHGDSIDSTLTQIIRAATIEGLQQEFEPLVRQYQRRLTEALPSDLQFSANFTFRPEAQTDYTSIGTVLLGGLGFLLKRFPIVAIVLPIVQTLLGAFMSNRQREAEQAQRLEQARQYVLHSLIPQVLPQIQHEIDRTLTAHMQAVHDQIQQQAEQQEQIYQTTMQQLQQQLQHSQAEIQQAKAQYQQDLDAVQQLQQQWQSL